jgi:DNA-binding YbaB/EbfC family protein|tara:strand:- start:189 stop:527 length:339 start_codon:yes stop_codon:yes gene_type:complete
MLKRMIIMTDFSKILDKAKELENKMKESQEKIKTIKAEGVSGSNSIKVTLNGDGEMTSIEISKDIMNEDKAVIEDLIIAAHNNAKEKLKSKTSEEISKVTGGFGIPGFKWPL